MMHMAMAMHGGVPVGTAAWAAVSAISILSHRRVAWRGMAWHRGKAREIRKRSGLYDVCQCQ